MALTRHVRAVVAALLATLLLAGTAAPALAADPAPTPSPATTGTKADSKAAAKTSVVTFGVQPARKGKPDARPYFNFAVTPGAVLRDQVAVRNYSTTPLTLRVYATDALNLQDGGFGLLPRAQAPVDAGAWIAIGTRGGRGFVTVPARKSVVVPIRLKVPHDATPGDHVGGVVVSLTTQSKNTEGAAVELDQRVGSRVFIRVSGPLHPSLSIDQVRPTYDGVLNPLGRGQTRVSYVVRNTGNVKLGGRQQVSVRGPFGPTARASGLVDVPLLLPGGSYQASAVVRGVVPLVRESLTVRLTPLVVPGDVVPGLHAVTATATFSAWPWPALAVLVALALLLAAGLALRRWRGRPGTGRHGPASAVTETPDVPLVPVARALLVAASVALVTLLGAVAPAEPAYAQGAPYADPAAVGRITLCDGSNRPITTGSVKARPFVPLAVGTAPPAPGYGGPGRVANLLAFQPRQGVVPGDWNGLAMSANTRYSNPAHPMARTVPHDYSLSDYLQAYPTRWQGLVQLRMYLRAPGQPTYRFTYNALDLRVVGDTWSVVGAPGTASCTAGTAVSVATILGVGGASTPATPARTPSGTSEPSRSATPAASSPPSGTSPSATTPATGGSTTGMSPAANTAAPSSSSLGPWSLPAALAALAALTLIAAGVRHRRSARAGRPDR